MYESEYPKARYTHLLQLIVAEEAANRALYQLEQARARIAAVEAEARVMEQYRDLVEEGRQQFHREMASIMPDVKLGEKNSKLTEDELNMFITHAYRKVSKAQCSDEWTVSE